ncbi:MAG: RNA polymerase sigma factor [Bacteroidales bacterium]
MTAIEFNNQVLSLREKLRYFAISLTSNVEDAEDLLQDTLLKAITNRDKFDPATNLRAWIYTIMKNTFINKYRKESKISMVIDNTRDLYYLNNSSTADQDNPEGLFNHEEVSKIVQELQDEHRIPFQMHFQGYKYKEIAEQLNLSIGTVKSRIFFSRKKLMDRLRDFQN